MEKELKKLIKETKVVILDFDNTMASTEKYSWQAYSKILKEKGVTFFNEHISRYIGKPDIVIIQNMEKDYNITLPYEETVEKRIKKYLHLALEDNVRPYDYIIELFKEFPNKDYYIMSSNTLRIIKPILEKWNLLNKIKNIYTFAENPISKEERIKNSLEYFEVLQKDLITFEDSPSTINIAKNYNVKSVFIETDLNKNQNCNYDYKIIV